MSFPCRARTPCTASSSSSRTQTLRSSNEAKRRWNSLPETWNLTPSPPRSAAGGLLWLPTTRRAKLFPQRTSSSCCSTASLAQRSSIPKQWHTFYGIPQKRCHLTPRPSQRLISSCSRCRASRYTSPSTSSSLSMFDWTKERLFSGDTKLVVVRKWTSLLCAAIPCSDRSSLIHSPLLFTALMMKILSLRKMMRTKHRISLSLRHQRIRSSRMPWMISSKSGVIGGLKRFTLRILKCKISQSLRHRVLLHPQGVGTDPFHSCFRVKGLHHASSANPSRDATRLKLREDCVACFGITQYGPFPASISNIVSKKFLKKLCRSPFRDWSSFTLCRLP